MNKVFAGLFFTAFIFVQLNCTRAPTIENAKETNANLPSVNESAAETNQAANVAVSNVMPQETPLSTFTDAGEALSEGDKLFDANENEKAIEAYRQAVKLNPELAEGYFKLGVAYALVESEQDETVSAEPTPAKSRAKKNKKEAPLIETNADKAFDNAIKAYKKILTKNPKDDVAQFNLGRSYNKLNEDKEAEKALRLAVKLKPDDSDYQTELGAILVKLAHYEEAVSALKKALKIDENNSQAQVLLEKAEAGRKRIDYGVNKIKQQMQQQQQQNKPE